MSAVLSRRLELACEAYYLLGQSDREIAAAFGIGRKAVTMRRARARKIILDGKASAEQRERYAAALRRHGKRSKLKPIQLSLADPRRY